MTSRPHVLTRRCWRLVSDQLSMRCGSTSRRHRLPSDVEAANTPDDRNRFDFGDTDFNSGFNFIAGARSQGGVFFEMRATAGGCPTSAYWEASTSSLCTQSRRCGRTGRLPRSDRKRRRTSTAVGLSRELLSITSDVAQWPASESRIVRYRRHSRLDRSTLVVGSQRSADSGCTHTARCLWAAPRSFISVPVAATAPAVGVGLASGTALAAWICGRRGALRVALGGVLLTGTAWLWLRWLS